MVRVRTKLRNKAVSSASLNQTCVKSSYLDGVWLMDQRDGPEELEREIELASRISASYAMRIRASPMKRTLPAFRSSTPPA